MIRNILVALDDTPLSLNALEQAIPLARAEKSRILLAAVIPPYDGDLRIMGDTQALEQQKAAFKKVLESARERVQQTALPVSTFLSQGEPYQEILALAEKEAVDLIVINKKNPFPMDLIPLGAFASRVIRQGGRDVLVVPKVNRLTLQHLVLGYDNSANACKAGERAIELALAYGSQLTVVTAFDVPLEGFAFSPGIWEKISREAGQLQEPLLEAARQKGVRRLEHRVVRGSTSQVIIDVAREVQADLIILGAPRNSGIRQFAPGKVMERVICNGAIAVWIAGG